jgi:ABC-type Zn uptake system ZnuABC Zn-binding protein ZnuA/ABC-type Mn2+/Zn2+ transport system permease subunit
LLYARAVLESLDLPFVQRGLAEVLLLSIGAGLIGTWVVLRGLAFHSHAVGTAAFPGLVLADGLGFAAALGALGAAAVFAVLVSALARRRSDDRGSEVALVLVGMLALGVILASDVFESSAALETLLFGSLFLIDGGELALAAAMSAAALAATIAFGHRWLARGFDADGEGTPAPSWLEPLLLGLVALGTAAAVTAVGALLVTALFVIPAATTRLWTSRLRTWQVATVALCAAEGMAGVVLSVELNAPPGATIALLAGLVFALAALVAAVRRGTGRAGRPLARWAAAGAAMLLISGCGSDSSGTGEVSVVATTPVAGDLVTRVAGDGFETRTLLAANTDPHEYEPRPEDIEALATADLVVASGGDLDEWIGDAIEESGSSAELLTLADGIPHQFFGGHTHDEEEHADEEHAGEEEHADEESAEELDPHWWHDPRNAAAAVGAIGAALSELDPDAAGAVERNASDYADEIDAADAAIARCLRSVPADDRKLVTDHDAFGYLADRYDIEVVGAIIPATTTEAQASAGELAELRDLIESEGVRAVFPESSVTTDLAETIADETGATADYELYGDSLGPEGSPATTYLDMIRANAESLMRGFTGGERGCEA